MSDGATYKINQDGFTPGSYCECGHSVEAHGSKGMMCAGCKCKQFVREEAEAVNYASAESR